MRGVQLVNLHIEDLTIKRMAREMPRMQQYAAACLTVWKPGLQRLWAEAVEYEVLGKHFAPVFHCFGGINRSSAALCAWLILRHDLTVEEALMHLLCASQFEAVAQSRLRFVGAAIFVRATLDMPQRLPTKQSFHGSR